MTLSRLVQAVAELDFVVLAGRLGAGLEPYADEKVGRVVRAEIQSGRSRPTSLAGRLVRTLALTCRQWFRARLLLAENLALLGEGSKRLAGETNRPRTIDVALANLPLPGT